MAERTPVSVKPRELLRTQTKNLDGFFGREITPESPNGLIEFIEFTKVRGFTFEPYLTRNIMFTETRDFPGWRIKPNRWFWDNLGKSIPSESARMVAGWSAMETITRPNYTNGSQLYENDALAKTLEDLRKEGQIKVPDHVKHVPAISRFGVSPEEIEGPVVARFAKLAKIDPKTVSAARYIEFNYLGNLSHPEFGQANTGEWFKDKFGRDDHLYGGDANDGGLAGVDYGWADSHRDGIGFRLQVDFSSSK